MGSGFTYIIGKVDAHKATFRIDTTATYTATL
jgi:hypothetical protein